MCEERVSTDTVYKIRRLKADNYFLWSKKMKLILMAKGVWPIVCGLEKCPVREETMEDIDEFEKKLTSFDKRKNIALTTIMLAIDDSIIGAVIESEDPCYTWNVLKRFYDKVSLSNVDNLLQQYNNTAMGANESIMAYASRLCVIENRLSGVGYRLSEMDKVRAVLRGLRKEFAVTAEVIRGMNADRSTAIGLLMSKEGCRDATSGANDAHALQVRHNRKNVECYYCGKKGHIKKYCFNNPKSSRYKGNRDEAGAASSHCENKNKNDDDKDGTALFSLVTTALTSRNSDILSSEKWYVDSGCTSHMTNNAKFIRNMRESEVISSVAVGSGDNITVSGVGNLEATVVCDGKKNHVELKDVLYVPGLMCNLLSVSRMRRNGVIVVFDQCRDGRGFVELKSKSSGQSIAKDF